MTATGTVRASIIPNDGAGALDALDTLDALEMLLRDATAGDDDALDGACQLLLSAGWDARAVAGLRACVQDVRAQADRLHRGGLRAACDDLLGNVRVRVSRGAVIAGERSEAVRVQWGRQGWGYLLPGCEEDTGRVWMHGRNLYRAGKPWKLPQWWGLVDNASPLVRG